MSIIPPSYSLVRFDNATLITAPDGNERKHGATGKHIAAYDSHLDMMISPATGTNSPQTSRRPVLMKDSTLEEILDKILPPK